MFAQVVLLHRARCRRLDALPKTKRCLTARMAFEPKSLKLRPEVLISLSESGRCEKLIRLTLREVQLAMVQKVLGNGASLCP